MTSSQQSGVPVCSSFSAVNKVRSPKCPVSDVPTVLQRDKKSGSSLERVAMFAILLVPEFAR
ncbi:uncharacterized protein N7469_005483 [Penicillium citrinum]|uniref:Uncharacterized protein n=1 Tax=Penicillium citrinum TaxID=5077 RepID=A0A9W9P1N8_PENCI|nr:uncharacterized protein N7469_005483 [Penicillium citrinum]KAJ5233717.1 hypothetical protein N7469_005483 [Penicillium citrinum]